MLRGKHKKLDNLAEKRLSIPLNSMKTTSLLEHTSKIEQKLTFLKQKISQKKKKSTEEKSNLSDSLLSNFMARIGLSEYLNQLIQNGIDSLDILKEIKQSQLEEIGVLKGHALKIIIHLRKDQEKARKMSVVELNKSNHLEKGKSKSRQETKPSLSHTTIEKPVIQTTIDQIQTQSFPVSKVNKSFCLYCFTRSESNYCSSNCQMLYQNMFSKYESNLQKAEDSFIPKQAQKQEQLSDNQQFLQNFDFLFNPQQENFDIEEYEEIKTLIKR